ncbi:hypothetical protein IQ273_08165 [Nodosilinea sp. LEGE 07298]|uniref:hypothetical protein n=1 Tax=Nodosilinea sp. LEGE 07298 TaxID=2777970 RepID=UPI00187F30F6|nr:hypothetical protein [Nodosilinea sp. LEGE 07298]MBE9109390.1 hypothetical protein [Nodosilinea sp. LEGE 07298]
MSISRRLPALAGIGLVSNVLIACAGVLPMAPQPAPLSETGAVVTELAATATGWADILGPVPAPDNWQVEPCVNEVLLCVEANGELIGTVERFSYPVGEVALPTGETLTAGAEREFLRAWVADHYGSIERDRKTADPALTFTSEPPQAIDVGSLPGLRYGYTVTHPNGALFDRGIGYVATDGNQVHVFVTGVISGDPTGSFSDQAAVEAFEPHLNTIIQGLRL